MNYFSYDNLYDAFFALNNDKTYTYIENNQDEVSIKACDFKKKVHKMLCFLLRSGLHSGDELILQVKNCLDFTCIFWACILGRIIPVPYNYLETDRDYDKLLKMYKKLKKPYIVADTTAYKRLLQGDPGQIISDDLKIDENKIVSVENFENEPIYKLNTEQLCKPRSDDVAFIQFSSGSTSDPKGIALTHRNIIYSISSVIRSVRLCSKDVYLSWLPLSHNFGLVGTYLTPLLAGCCFYIMSPSAFVSNPSLWIEKLSEHRATVSASPDFGLKRICKYLKKSRKHIDLSSLRMIYVGAEPISSNVSKTFYDITSTYGMKNTVLMPSYGLTEATLTVSVPKQERGVVDVYLDRSHMKIGEKVVECKSSVNSACFVEVGEFIDNIEAKIVDTNGERLEDGKIGHLFVKGQVVFSGYYNDPKATEHVFDEKGWFNTGDLGFIRNGRLVITGRAKDVIFINGENFYLHDIEGACQNVCGDVVNRTAVGEIYNSEKKCNQLICFIELNPEKKSNLSSKDLSRQLKRQVLADLGIAIAKVIQVDTIPLTSSGKIKRYELINQYSNIAQ